MPTATTVPKLLPPRDHALFDPRTGQLTHDLFDPRTGQLNDIWYEYLKSIDALVRALRLEIP